jgi:hypothetical protein
MPNTRLFITDKKYSVPILDAKKGGWGFSVEEYFD